MRLYDTWNSGIRRAYGSIEAAGVPEPKSEFQRYPPWIRQLVSDEMVAQQSCAGRERLVGPTHFCASACAAPIKRMVRAIGTACGRGAPPLAGIGGCFRGY